MSQDDCEELEVRFPEAEQAVEGDDSELLVSASFPEPLSLLSLPPELFTYHILKFLTPIDLVRVSGTKSTLRSLATSGAVWEPLSRALFGNPRHLYRYGFRPDDSNRLYLAFFRFKREGRATTRRFVRMPLTHYTPLFFLGVLIVLLIEATLIAVSLLGGASSSSFRTASIVLLVVFGCLFPVVVGSFFVYSDVMTCCILKVTNHVRSLKTMSKGAQMKDRSVERDANDILSFFYDGDRGICAYLSVYQGFLWLGLALVLAVIGIFLGLLIRQHDTSHHWTLVSVIAMLCLHEVVHLILVVKSFVSLIYLRVVSRRDGTEEYRMNMIPETCGFGLASPCIWMILPNIGAKILIWSFFVPIALLVDGVINPRWIPLLCLPVYLVLCGLCCGFGLCMFFVTLTACDFVGQARRSRKCMCLLTIASGYGIPICWCLFCLSFLILLSLRFSGAVQIEIAAIVWPSWIVLGILLSLLLFYFGRLIRDSHQSRLKYVGMSNDIHKQEERAKKELQEEEEPNVPV